VLHERQIERAQGFGSLAATPAPRSGPRVPTKSTLSATMTPWVKDANEAAPDNAGTLLHAIDIRKIDGLIDLLELLKRGTLAHGERDSRPASAMNFAAAAQRTCDSSKVSTLASGPPRAPNDGAVTNVARVPQMTWARRARRDRRTRHSGSLTG